jgi:hypothetical protein
MQEGPLFLAFLFDDLVQKCPSGQMPGLIAAAWTSGKLPQGISRFFSTSPRKQIKNRN